MTAHKKKVEFHTDHNVYIIGAGYSAAAGLPLLTNFLQKMCIYRTSLNDDSEYAKAIDNVLSYRRDCASASDKIKLDLDNIETLLSLAAASPEVDIQHDIAIAIGATIDHYQKLFNKIPVGSRCLRTKNEVDSPNPIRQDFYQYSAAIMSGDEGKLQQRENIKNTIISFNYDMLIEDALASQGYCFTYGFDGHDPIPDSHCNMQGGELPERACYLLKLHGSINWSEGGIESTDRDVKRYIFTSFDELMEKSQDRIPLILPPWWKKDPIGIFGKIWETAVERLRTATRIIFLGYSCPATDQYVKYLLAAGLQNNISLARVDTVNPDIQVQDAVAGLFPASAKWVSRSPALYAEDFFQYVIRPVIPNQSGHLEAINRIP